MKIVNNIQVTKGIGFYILEVDDVNVQQHFDKRFQLMLEINYRRVLPKNREEFLEFQNKDYLYNLNSEKTGETIALDDIQYHELMLCNRTLDECTTSLMEYVAMYNQGVDLKNKLKEEYKF